MWEIFSPRSTSNWGTLHPKVVLLHFNIKLTSLYRFGMPPACFAHGAAINILIWLSHILYLIINWSLRTSPTSDSIFLHCWLHFLVGPTIPFYQQEELEHSMVMMYWKGLHQTLNILGVTAVSLTYMTMSSTGFAGLITAIF